MRFLYISPIIAIIFGASLCQDLASCQQEAIQNANSSLTATINSIVDQNPSLPEASRSALITAISSPLSDFLNDYQSNPITALADLPPSIGSSVLVALKEVNGDGNESIEQMYQIVLDVTRAVLPAVSTLRVELKKCSN